MLRIIPLSAIRVADNRQRREFEPVSLLELAKSIETYGLFHALQIRKDNTLVTGERRLRAIKEHLLPMGKSFTYDGEMILPGHIPCIEVTSDDPLVLEAIELDENFRRRDLTWQEHAAAVKRLHDLRQAQLPPGEVQSIPATAAEVIGEKVATPNSIVTTRAELLVAEHLDKPAVAAAPTVREALKALKRIEETERNEALALAVGKTLTSGSHKVVHGNCIDWLAEQPPEQFDVICTDPPYGMGADQFGDGAGKLSGIEHGYDDSLGGWRQLMFGDCLSGDRPETSVWDPGMWSMDGWCAKITRVARPQAHAYIFCDPDRFPELRDGMREAGWYVFRTPLIVYKKDSGRVPLPDKGPRRQYETILYAIKGGKLTNGIFSDVIESQADPNMSHGAQKPVSVYENLLRRSVRPGDAVLDTFGGTGPLIPAAHTLKCFATVIEQEAAYYGLCLKRLEALK